MLWYTLLVLLVALLIMAPAAALASLASHTAEQRRHIEEQELLQRQAVHDLLRRQMQLHVQGHDVQGQDVQGQDVQGQDVQGQAQRQDAAE